jgi:signal transduction histidine kinase
MTAAVLDERRAAQVHRYRVVGRTPRRELVAIAEIATQLAGTSMASINLLDDRHQHQVATAGFRGIVCAREDAMCNTALVEEEPVIVEDARQDPRFAQNPFVTGELGSVRFYAAHQLRAPDGVVLGMLCVLDPEPRTISSSQRVSLRQLAERVVDLLELEVRTRELERRTDELTSAVRELRDTQHELQRSNEQLTAFAGRVSHDLRNPLTAVSMSLDLISEQIARPLPVSGDLRFVVQRAARATRRMRSLIDDRVCPRSG